MSYNMLIVDDSSIIRSVVKKTINMSGIPTASIFEAANGFEALELLEKEWIDIVLADINMPEMNGVELVQKMSENSLLASIPVVIISSDRNESKIELLQKHGIRAYLKKPFRPENFKEVINNVLGPTGE